ncbi:MAG: hypothetical protein IKH11_01800 [Bacteroidales bacterium]|nr:hypothetical protein [Bacteroidales bacterium]
MRNFLHTVFLLVALAAASRASAQNVWVSADFDFAGYLLDNGLKKDAKALLSRNVYFPSDTLTYLRAWVDYQLKELEPALSGFRAVPRDSGFAEKSFFYANAVSAYLGDFETPSQLLEGYGGAYKELGNMQLAGLALLRGDAETYRKASAGFAYSDFALTKPEQELQEIYELRFETKAKSPLLAAAASAVVPGLGKIYAGRVGEGVEAFLLTGIMAGITAEHWVKDGIKDWKTIVPGILCAALYIGNIYGSYVSVSIYNKDLKNAQDTAILYDIHIPLRSVFK